MYPFRGKNYVIISKGIEHQICMRLISVNKIAQSLSRKKYNVCAIIKRKRSFI